MTKTMRTELAELLAQAIKHVSVYWPGTSDRDEALAAHKEAVFLAACRL